MRIDKKHIGNILFVVFIVVLLFTPLGFQIKVHVNRLISFSPSVVEKPNQKRVADYNWDLHSSENTNFNLNTAKGKVVFINMWATWCPSCVAEMPSIQKLYSSFGSEVIFLCIAQDDHDKVEAYMKKNKFTFPVYYQKSKSPKELESDRIPTTFILDKEGNIVVEKTGAADWNSTTTIDLLHSLYNNR
ncbi:TlpA disulfide reductase family protein [Maribacter sp.]|uniref:TlpA family protein disulfide reductase n=1 Tax=Maribacter sp. TaxID=1897614 RepID=UPI0025C66425|nr:TlpA disulfide reductase family protein [Maribacter sp.]